VLAHVAGCEDCARVWNDLQKAQELVLNLPVHTTSRDFRQTLWARIESGEGSPEITFGEPIPWLAKARYVLVGAAAAALVLLGGHLLWKDDPIVVQPDSGSLVAAARVPAANGKAPSASATERVAAGVPLHPKVQVPFGGMVELSPLALAQEIANHAARNVRALRSRLCDDPRSLPTSYQEPEIARLMAELRISAEMMRWMQEDGLLSQMPPKVEADLRLITYATRPSDTPTVQAAICEGADLEKLPELVYARGMDSVQFLRQFQIRLDRDPSLNRHVWLSISPSAGAAPPVAFFQLRFDR